MCDSFPNTSLEPNFTNFQLEREGSAFDPLVLMKLRIKLV